MRQKSMVVVLLFLFMVCLAPAASAAVNTTMNVTITNTAESLIDWQRGFIEVTGYGLSPAGTVNSPLAKRAAVMDAYRNFLEIVKGVQINSETTVQNLMVQSDIVQSRVSGFVRGAKIISEKPMPDGSYQVVMRLPLYGNTGLEAVIPQVTPIRSNDLQRVNLQKSKIVLDRLGDNTELLSDEITINLNWYQQRKNYIRDNEKVDLDLGCLYELENGEKGSIQPLGNDFGVFEKAPFVRLDVDDRSGAVVTGENLKINGRQVEHFKRILVYSYIYKGVNNWAQIDGVATIKQPGKPDIIVKLNEMGNARMCAVALIEKTPAGKLRVTRQVQYFAADSNRTMQEVMDRAYGWGLNWEPTRK